MQMFLKLLSAFSIVIAMVLLLLTLMVTFGIAPPVAVLGLFLAFYLAYLCWSRPRARTVTSVFCLIAIIVLGSYLYSLMPTESVDSDPSNYLIAEDTFTAHARDVMPQTLEYAQATHVDYRHMRYGSSVQYIRLDYSFSEEDFEAQADAFSERYNTKTPFAMELDGASDAEARQVYQIETEQDVSYFFAYALDRQKHEISLLYLYDPLLTEQEPESILSDWHFASNGTSPLD